MKPHILLTATILMAGLLGAGCLAPYGRTYGKDSERFKLEPSRTSSYRFGQLERARRETAPDRGLVQRQVRFEAEPAATHAPAPELPARPAPELPARPAPEMPARPAPEMPARPAPEMPARPAPEMPARPAPEMLTAPMPAPEPLAPSVVDGDMLPPDAKPGECYARVLIPPTYETFTETVLVEAESSRLEIVPARYEWRDEQVLVQDASEELSVIPAEYEWVEEDVLVQPASVAVVEVPAEYEWKEERVLVKPAHTVWKTGRGPLEKIDDGTGEIMCLVEVPAVYETVRKKVLKSDERTETVKTPAKYDKVRKRVMIAPARTEKKVIPAEYRTVRMRKEVAPEERRTVTIPAKYDTIEKRKMVSRGHVAWQRVLCETNLSDGIIKQIQQALVAAGYQPGDPDGVLGPQTRVAIEAYQNDNGLATGGLTYETLQKLGVIVPRISED